MGWAEKGAVSVWRGAESVGDAGLVSGVRDVDASGVSAVSPAGVVGGAMNQLKEATMQGTVLVDGKAATWEVIHRSDDTQTECLPIEGGLLYRTTVRSSGYVTGEKQVAVALVFVPHVPVRDEDL